jgi:hypothetical protein
MDFSPLSRSRDLNPDVLNIGDIVYVTGCDILGCITQWITGAPTHVGIVCDPYANGLKYIAEMVRGQHIRQVQQGSKSDLMFNPFTDYDKKHSKFTAITSIKRHPLFISAKTRTALSILLKTWKYNLTVKYDVPELLSFLWGGKDPQPDTKHLICSRAVYALTKYCGVNWPDSFEKKVSPADLYNASCGWGEVIGWDKRKQP